MNNIAYKIVIKPVSPLSIGSGLDENTDSDIIVSRNGLPFVPATAIAGVLKSYIALNAGDKGRVIANSIFGYIPDSKEALEKAKNGDEDYIERKSIVSVYDGLPSNTMTNDSFFVAVRHRVALKDKVSIKGAKFDMEALEPGDDVSFTAYIQLYDNEGNKWALYLEEALAALNEGIIGLGADTSRGYGRVSLEVWKKEFDDIEQWLDFDLQAGPWGENNKLNDLKAKDGDGLLLTVHLKLEGAISIREYSTAVKEADYSMMSLHKIINKDNGKEFAPVIPGTSWAGAFRDRFADFLPVEADIIKNLFGYVDEKDNKSHRAGITFSESQISGGTNKIITRNSLDRFSMATKSGALYTERTHYGGETELDIRLLNHPDDKIASALGACLMDLHRGFLAIGGLTSVGRGLFSVTHIDLNGEKSDEITKAVKDGNIEKFAESLVKKEENQCE